MPQPLLEAMPYTRDDRLNGVQGLAHALQAIGTLLMMCDARDLGVAVGENLAIAEDVEASPSAQGRPSVYTKIFEPNIYLYDKYPGGIGFSEPLFRLSPNLLENTRRLIMNCPCESGCPSCVGPVGEVGEKGKGSGAGNSCQHSGSGIRAVFFGLAQTPVCGVCELV